MLGGSGPAEGPRAAVGVPSPARVRGTPSTDDETWSLGEDAQFRVTQQVGAA